MVNLDDVIDELDNSKLEEELERVDEVIFELEHKRNELEEEISFLDDDIDELDEEYNDLED